MTSEPELTENFKGIIEKRGRGALEQAKHEILDSPYDGGVVSSALKYFAQVTLKDILPVFPALISLSCEAVGQKTEKTTSIGAALSLITGVADIHDDIIDKSAIKYSKQTVFGKFGSDIALLAGDALLMQGIMLLHRECESLPREQSRAILNLTHRALFEICNAEAKEIGLMKKLDTKPEEYFEVIRLKAVVPEVHCKIGGILGNTDEKTVQSLGNYGRTFGIVATVRDEFIDLLEYPELKNRLKNECLPLPIMYALRNSEIRGKIKPILESSIITKNNVNEIIKIVMSSEEIQELKNSLKILTKEAHRKLAQIVKFKENNNLLMLLKAASQIF